MPSPDIIRQTLQTPHGEHAYRIVEALNDNGFEAWWVGGSVRDMALETIPDDIDIATNASPDDTAKLFSDVDATSKELGSILVPKGKHLFEVTTFREDDSSSDGRHPESVSFGNREGDAARRDFTINALYWNPISHELWDPYKGMDDLKEKLVHFIGEPGIRIQHDVLRMLRAVRFRSLIDGQYHPETYRAIQENHSSISILSGTRVQRELEKMLLNPNPDRALEDLWELGLLQELLPELYNCKGIPQPADYHKEGDVWDHTLQCIASSTPEHSIDVRLAILFHDCGKAETYSLKERIRFNEHASVSGNLAVQALTRLQYSKKRIDKINWLIRHHMMVGEFAKMPNDRKAHWYYHPWFNELLQLFWLDIAGTTPSDFSLHEQELQQYHRYLDTHPRPVKPLLNGEEVMDILGITPGEQVGKVLQALQKAQIDGEVRSREEARGFVEKFS